MSDNRPTYDTSSSDEEPSNHFHIQLPQRQLNLQEIRKQNHKKHEKPTIAKQTASNLAKAKKITTGSNHKFGNSINNNNNNANKHLGSSSAGTNRRSLISPTSSTHVSSDDDDDDDDNAAFYGDKLNDNKKLNVFADTKNNLSHFQFNADGIKPKSLHGQSDDSSDDDGNNLDEVEDETHSDFAVLNQNHPPQQYYETDSSDEDEEDDDEVPQTVHKTYSNASSGRSSRLSRKKSMSETTDTRAPIPPTGRRSTNSNHSRESSGRRSTSSGNINSGGGLKGILRKMSLVDSTPVDSTNQDISHSDTFLGRVLNFGTNQGLSGGGLAPGASRVIREEDEGEWNLDEERRVGFAAHENDRDAFEMQPLNYEDLSEEAKQLIQQHVPGAGASNLDHSQQSSAAPSTEITPSQSPNQHLLNEKSNNNENNQQSTTVESSSSTSSPGEDEELARRRASEERKKAENPFYTPNPDLFLRGTNADNQELHQAPNDFLHDMDGDYIAPPKQVQAGVLSSLLRLYQNPQEQKSASSLSRVSTGTSGTALSSFDDTYDSDDYKDSKSSLNVDLQHKLKLGIKGGSKAMFNKAANKLKHHSHTRTNTVETQGSSNLEEFSNDKDEFSNGYDDDNKMNANLPSFQNARPKMPKKKTTEPVQKLKKLRHKQRAERLRITVHIADILQRQRFIMNMCRALMLFGAPTHRLEEYMVMTSRVLEIDGQFIYFPGCMLVSFGDAATRTSEVHLVRCAQGINLSKLADTHKIYKAVIHDLIGVEDASKKLDDLLKSKSRYPPWLCVLFYGLGSLAVTPFAFEGGWLDLPISFGVGLCVGYLQFYVSSISNLYSSVFEVSAAIVVAFIARGIGSIKGGDLFCFLAIAQGSLAIILPGYIILCGSLELQSRNLVAGAVRMFYAVIYSLFLGFGITLGAALYGWIDHNATSANSCALGHAIDEKWRILFVPMFALCLGLINQARWSQVPIMIVIAGIGYIGSFFAGKHFSTVTEFTACIGAFIVGVLGNLYSRIWKGMAVSAMLPAIFVQVPSGIASKSSLISGLNTADQITNKSSSNNGGTVTNDASSLSFGATMVEVSIGISVGLFAAALIIYPFGKKRTGLFAL